MAYKRARFGYRNVHKTAYFAGKSWIAPDIEAGEHSFINNGCIITARIKIGRYVLIGPRVVITGDNHIFDSPGVPIIFSGMPERQMTVIEDDAWIGVGSTIMSGVTIGRGSIIAAGSVVTKPIPPFEIHGGVPTRKLRDRFDTEEARLRHEQLLDGPTVAGSLNPPRKYTS